VSAKLEEKRKRRF